MRILRLLALLLIAVPAFAEKAATLPAPTAYVDDYAGVLSDSGKAQVEAVCREVHAKTKAQIFFVTIHSLEGEQISTFANDLFHRWKIGEKKTDRGVLILLAVADHKRRIEVGFGLEPIITDGEAGRIGRAMVPALQANDYDQAAKIGVDDIAKIIADDAGVTLDVAPPPPRPVVAPQPAIDHDSGIGLLVVVGLLIASVFLFIILLALRGRRRMQSYGASSIYPPEPVPPIVPFIPFDSGGSTGSSFTSDDSSSFSSPDSSSSDSFSGGGGGDSGGGGADGGW